MVQTPRIDAVPRLPRPVSGPSRTSIGGTTICEKYPWYLSKLHKAPPLHRGQYPHRQQRFMMQQRLRQGLGPANGWEIPSHYWLSTLWGLDAVEGLLCQKCQAPDWATETLNIFSREWGPGRRENQVPFDGQEG